MCPNCTSDDTELVAVDRYKDKAYRCGCCSKIFVVTRGGQVQLSKLG